MNIFERDSYLEPYKKIITDRYRQLIIAKETIAGYGNTLSSAINNHIFYGVHAEGKYRVFREWAPNAANIWLIGDFNGWKKYDDWKMHKVAGERFWKVMHLRLTDGQEIGNLKSSWIKFLMALCLSGLCSGIIMAEIMQAAEHLKVREFPPTQQGACKIL